MLQKKSKKNPSSSLSFKENNPTVPNVPSKTTLDNDSKPLSKSAQFDRPLKSSTRLNNINNNKKKQSSKDIKAMPKSIIKEKPNRTPSKDWHESPPDSRPKEKEMPRTPIHTEKVTAYEMHFPALGSENSKTETPPSSEKPDALTFSTEILSPTNVALHQVYKDQSEISSILLQSLQSMENFEEKMEDLEQKPEIEEEQEDLPPSGKKYRVIPDEKIVEYESHFPALGDELEAQKPEHEFDTEVLSPKHLTAVAIDVANAPITVAQGDWESSPVEAQKTAKELMSMGLIKEKTSQSAQLEQEEEDTEYIKIESQQVPQTHLDQIKRELDIAVEEAAQNSIGILDADKPFCILHKELVPQMPLDSTAEDIEPERPVIPEDAKNVTVPLVFEAEKPVKGGIEAEEFEVMLATEIEQQDEAAIISSEDKEEKYEGKEQRAKQDEEIREIELEKIMEEVEEEEEVIVDRESYKPIRLSIRDDELEILLEDEAENEVTDEEEEEFGNYSTAEEAVQVEVQPQIEELRQRSTLPVKEDVEVTAEKFGVIAASRKRINDQDDMKSIEEEIVDVQEEEEEEEHELEGQGAGEDIKGLDRNEMLVQERNSEPQEHAKGKIRSSLEHIAEDPSLSQSTDLTLSAQRIDLIKEEIREAEERKKTQDALFQEVEKNLLIVKGLESSKMYGAAINVLKKSLDTLDTKLIRHSDTNIKEVNRLLVECNFHIASCYNNVNEFRLSLDYAHATLKLDSKNIKALYLLGTSLLKCKDNVGGYGALREARDLACNAEDGEYLQLIDAELRKYEKKLEQIQNKVEQKTTPGAIKTPTDTKKPVSKEVRKIKKSEPSSRPGSLACFVGAAMSSGVASWFITKNYMNMTQKKSLAYSIGIGVLIGGISVLILGHTRSKGSK